MSTSAVSRFLLRKRYGSFFITTGRYFSTKRAEEKVIKSDYEDVALADSDMCSYIFPKWERWADRDALEEATTGRKLTYGELIQTSLRWGAALQNLPAASSIEHKRVAILSRNCLEYAPIFYGNLAAGWTTVTINSGFTPGEVAYELKDSSPNVLVVHSELEDIAEEAIKLSRKEILLMTIGQSKSGKPNVQGVLHDKQAKCIDVVQIPPDDVAVILYSSGTTGKPKGVMISHRAMLSNTLISTNDTHLPGVATNIDSVQSNILGLLPQFHVFGLQVVTNCNLLGGSKTILLDHFDPTNFGNIIHKHKIRVLYIVTPILNFMLNSPSITKETLQHVREILIGASIVPASLAKPLEAKADRKIGFQEGYGLTEALITTITPCESIRLGYCGKLLPNSKAKLVDADGNTVGPNMRGDLLIKSPSIMLGYLNNAEATAEAIDSEGWLHTGDVATCTEDGYFSIVDRKKELIKVNTFQVSPAELEDCLLQHPAVSEVGVTGVPHERLGETPRAYVVLKGKATEEELQNHVKKHLSRHKWLEGGVHFLDQIPKTNTGKVLRRKLKELSESD